MNLNTLLNLNKFACDNKTVLTNIDNLQKKYSSIAFLVKGQLRINIFHDLIQITIIFKNLNGLNPTFMVGMEKYPKDHPFIKENKEVPKKYLNGSTLLQMVESFFSNLEKIPLNYSDQMKEVEQTFNSYCKGEIKKTDFDEKKKYWKTTKLSNDINDLINKRRKELMDNMEKTMKSLVDKQEMSEMEYDTFVGIAKQQIEFGNEK
ncbi:hypothetical protein QTN25_006593 [Entamoeba marina]